MEITVNGTTQIVNPGELNIARLLEMNEVLAPEMVAVQLNGRFVKRGTYEATRVQPGDEIEFLYFMGGGRQ